MNELKHFLNSKKEECQEMAHRSSTGGALDTLIGYIQCIDETLEFIDDNE